MSCGSIIHINIQTSALSANMVIHIVTYITLPDVTCSVFNCNVAVLTINVFCNRQSTGKTFLTEHFISYCNCIIHMTVDTSIP